MFSRTHARREEKQFNRYIRQIITDPHLLT